jgi:hypothetical protein
MTQKAIEIASDARECAWRAMLQPNDEAVSPDENKNLVLDFSEPQHYDTCVDQRAAAP